MSKHGHGGPMGMPTARPQNIGGTLRRLMRYVGRSKAVLVLVGICLLLSSLCSVAGTYLMKPIINNYIIPADFAGLLKMLVLMGAIYLTASGCSYLYARLMVRISQRTVAQLREELFSKMQKLPLRYFDTHSHGDLMSRYTNDIETVSEAINNSLGTVVSCSLTFLGTFTMMLVLNARLTLLTVVFLLLMLLCVKAIGGRSRKNFMHQQAAVGSLNGYIEEMMSGQKVIKVFNHEAAAAEGFYRRNEECRKAGTLANAFAAVMMPLMGNLSKINYAIVCCVGGLLALGGTFDVGGLIVYLTYVKQVSQPISQIAQQVNTILAAVAGAERIFAVMEEDAEGDEGTVKLVCVTEQMEETSRRTGRWAWKRSDGSLVPWRGDVRFENVDFSYVPEKPILKKVSLYAKPGQKVAFVGSTGAGKTTITNLINRFYDIDGGIITYDGIDVREISKESLCRSLGMVLQDTQLFTGTIRENIRYGRLDATDEEVEAAARLANADGFIRHLPHGYDTQLTDNGGNLSQGERQLLNIARAAVADPPVLILDEATSSIDTRTEKLIERGMDSLMQGRTVFVIAHRLSTVRNAKAILVLESGEIIERGDHEELLALRGRYYRLCTGKAELS